MSTEIKKMTKQDIEDDINDKKFKKFIFKNKTNNRLLISVDNISKNFHYKKQEDKKVFDNVSFNIYEGDVLCLLGNNGAGKTTITDILSGIIKQDTGEIKYFLEPNEEISVQFQDTNFPFGLTVKDIIDFQINICDLKFTAAEIKEMYDIFMITPIFKKKVNKLSGGQKQRVNVLIALLNKPKILFLDEFTTGLDIAIRNQIKKFIMTLAEKYKISIVLISHDIDIIKEIATRFVVLANKTVCLNATKKQTLEVFDSIDDMISYYVR